MEHSSTSLPYQKLFTQQDIRFLLNLFKPIYKTKALLIKTLEDPLSRHHLLSQKCVLEAIHSWGPLAPVSSYLYYAVQVTQGLEAAGIHEHIMAESLSLSITRVAQSLRQQLNFVSLDRPNHRPLTMTIGMRPAGTKKEFQILGDLQKACVVIEGTLTEQSVRGE